MFGQFRRTNFLEEVTTYDGINEYDLLLSNWDLFELNYPIEFDTIKPLDMQRPDYLSYRLYGLSEYWWVICKLNKIDDLWNDLYIGMDIIIPSEQDILEFYDRVKKRFRK
jgi:hypothetical protein